MQKYWGARIWALVYIGLAIYFGSVATEFPAGGGTFPLFATGAAILLCLLMLIKSFSTGKAETNETLNFSLSYERVKPLLLTLLVLVYLYVMFYIGYYISTLLFLFVSTLMVGIRNYKAVVLTGIILLPAMYAFFGLFLKANLPTGILF